MKIAFVDIDGTILDFSRGMNSVTDRTVSAFKKFRDKGNVLICATSRSHLPGGLRHDMFDGLVFNNGQYIAYQNQVLLNNTFSKDQVVLLYEVAKSLGGGCAFSGVSGQWLSPHHQDLAIKHMVHYGFDVSKLKTHFLPFDLDAIECTAVTASYADLETLAKAHQALPPEWEIHAYYDPKDIRMDVHLPGITKGSSCMKLVDHVGLSKADSYAFGDGTNDIEMLELVGYGVAMGNADPKVKAIADDHTDDCLEEGLAKAFERLFELN